MNTYNINLNIDANNKLIISTANLTYNCKTDELKELNLYIHKNMELEYIDCDKKIDYQVSDTVSDWCPFIIESKLIKIQFKQSIAINENIKFIFKYKGYIDIVNPYGINRLTKNWIELGLYTPWFPLVDKLEQSIFNVKISIDNDYEVINSNYESGRFILEQKIPHTDCTIIACRNFKNIKKYVGNTCISTYYTSYKEEKLAHKISEISIKAMKQYEYLGNVQTDKYSIVIAPREDGGGYCRPNLIVVTSDDDYENDIEYFKFIAHELAHSWWNKANVNSWEDWLNESFAEYSALIAVRDNFGENHFDKLISMYKEESKDLLQIRNLSRSDNNAYSVLYRKGPLVLNELERKIGKDRFKELLSCIHINKIDTTDKFLNMLKNNFGKQLRDYVDKLLDE